MCCVPYLKLLRPPARNGWCLTRHWDGVREADLSWLINEYHIACLGPREGIIDDISSRVDTTRSLLLEKTYHTRATGAPINP